MTATVNMRTWVTDDCTVGRLDFGMFRCFTLELPWRDNKQDISCIPEGVYAATHYISPLHGPVIMLHDVPDRTVIEMHAGNFTRNVLGCILVGDSVKYLDSDSIPDVTNSVRTLRKFKARLPRNFNVNITRTFESSHGRR